MKSKLTIAIVALTIVLAFFAGTLVGPRRAIAKATKDEAQSIKAVSRMFEEITVSDKNQAKAILVLAAVLASKQ